MIFQSVLKTEPHSVLKQTHTNTGQFSTILDCLWNKQDDTYNSEITNQNNSHFLCNNCLEDLE